MRHRWRHLAHCTAVAALLSGIGVGRSARADAGPTIEHQPITAAVLRQPIEIRARILSNTRFPVYRPSLYLRLPGLPNYTRIELRPVADIPDVYASTIQADLVTGSFDYYLETFDQDGNGPTRVGDADAPLHVSVTAAPQVAPAPAPPAAGGLTSSEATPAPVHSGHLGTYAALGVGGAGLVTSGVLGLLSLAKHTTARVEGPAGKQGAFASDVTTMNLEAGLAWGSLAVGVAGISLGSYWLLSTEPSSGAVHE